MKIKACSIKNDMCVERIWLSFEKYSSNSKYYLGHIYHNYIDSINDEISQHLYYTDTFIDFNYLISEVGIKASFDTNSKYRWNLRYSKKLINEICNEIYKQFLIHSSITKKCLVLDCDNVLWGGILSEDGIRLSSSGMGRSYYDFQRFLLELYKHGVILAICSKNDHSDVMKVFNEHSGMILKEEHIACFKTNWNNKVENIKNIAHDLNIGLDSIVFVDDSEFEIRSAKMMLPEVIAILYDRDTIYKNLSCFNLPNKIELKKIIQRNDTYRTNECRSDLKSECRSFDEYLCKLETKVDIHPALPMELIRLSGLTQRTNKCTNGRRYTVEQLKKLNATSEYSLYSVSVSDKFSDLGIVGAFGIGNDILDLFSLSCRILGRNIEEAMIEYIVQKGVLAFHFTSTGKNKDIELKLNKCFDSIQL